MERNIVETRFKAKKIDFLVMVALKPNEQNKNRLIWWARFPVLEIFNFDFFPIIVVLKKNTKRIYPSYPRSGIRFAMSSKPAQVSPFVHQNRKHYWILNFLR